MIFTIFSLMSTRHFSLQLCPFLFHIYLYKIIYVYKIPLYIYVHKYILSVRELIFFRMHFENHESNIVMQTWYSLCLILILILFICLPFTLHTFSLNIGLSLSLFLWQFRTGASQAPSGRRINAPGVHGSRSPFITRMLLVQIAVRYPRPLLPLRVVKIKMMNAHVPPPLYLLLFHLVPTWM